VSDPPACRARRTCPVRIWIQPLWPACMHQPPVYSAA
jgi:hypothetical protein